MTSRNTDSPGRPPHMNAPAWTGRRLAFDVLSAWQERGAFAARVLEELCRQHAVSSSERAFALDLSYTAIRRQATIDVILAAFVDRPRRDVESGLWRLLQLGVCQLVLMDRVPEHAALHETGELAKQLERPQWTGLLNGVLRSVSKTLAAETTSDPSAHGVPVGGNQFREFDRPLFADPDQSPAQYLAKAYSYPRWLIRSWLSRFEAVEATRLCQWFNSPSLQALRVNPLQHPRSYVQEILQAAGVGTTPGQLPEAMIAKASIRPVDLPGFREGWWSIQDESAMAAARLLAPQPGESILDLCAAPGGKSTHLAELMHDSGGIIAVDIDRDRLALVEDSARRLGLSCIETQLISPDGKDLPDGPFDAVLVDVPCSNTGVLGKRPEARWRVTPESITELIAIQIQLLQDALNRVRPGGRVVYSTCSIDSQENRGVVDTVLGERAEITLEQELIHRPGQPADGGYQALLVRGATEHL